MPARELVEERINSGQFRLAVHQHKDRLPLTHALPCAARADQSALLEVVEGAHYSLDVVLPLVDVIRDIPGDHAPQALGNIVSKPEVVFRYPILVFERLLPRSRGHRELNCKSGTTAFSFCSDNGAPLLRAFHRE